MEASRATCAIKSSVQSRQRRQTHGFPVRSQTYLWVLNLHVHTRSFDQLRRRRQRQRNGEYHRERDKKCEQIEEASEVRDAGPWRHDFLCSSSGNWIRAGSAEVVGGDGAGSGPLGQVLNLLREPADTQLRRVADDWNHEPSRGINGYAEVTGVMVGHFGAVGAH